MGSAHRTLTAMHSLFSLLALSAQALPYPSKTLGLCARRRASTPTRPLAQSSIAVSVGAGSLSWSCSNVLQGPSGYLETPSALILRATLVKSDKRPKLPPQLKQPLLPQPLLPQHKLPPQRQPAPPPPSQQQFPQRRHCKPQRTQALRSVPGLAWLLMVTATTSGSASGSPLPTSSSPTSTAAPTGRSSQ